jgi:hypothetical protein
MKTSRFQSIITMLTIATLVAIGSQPTYAQKFSFGGKSQSKSRGGSNFSTRSKSSNFNQSRKSTPSFGQSSSRSKSTGSMTTRLQNRTTGIKNLIGNRNPSSKGLASQLQSKGNTANKTTGRFGDLKSRIGELTNGRSTFNKDKITGGSVNRDNRLEKLKNSISSKSGHHSPLQQLIHNNQRHNKVCISNQNWCHTKPKHCHWWYDWCKPIRYCEPVHQVNCSWNYVTCDYIVEGQVVVEDARWYLGMKGLLLPGKGIGIEDVANGSPAASVGLLPGMVITRCNGVDLVDETALQYVIENSQGVLKMDLLLSDETPASCVVVMQRIASQSY